MTDFPCWASASSRILTPCAPRLVPRKDCASPAVARTPHIANSTGTIQRTSHSRVGVTPTARAPSVVLGMPIHCWTLCGPSQGSKGSHPWRLLERDPIVKSGSEKFNAAVNHQHAGEVCHIHALLREPRLQPWTDFLLREGASSPLRISHVFCGRGPWPVFAVPKTRQFPAPLRVSVFRSGLWSRRCIRGVGRNARSAEELDLARLCPCFQGQ